MARLDITRIFPQMGLSAGELVGIELTGTTLKLAQIEPSGSSVQVVNLVSRPIRDLPDEEVSRLIKSALAELKVKNPRLVDIIPTNLVITKNIEVPSLNPQEIREIINLQAGRHTPFSRDEIIIDYLNLGVHKHSYSKILLLIIARSIVRKHFDIVEAAGHRIERVLLAPEGIASASARALHVDSSASPIVLLSVDELSCDFCVASDNKVMFVRSIPIGAQHLLEEGADFSVKFAEEVKNSLEAYQSEDIDKPPSSVVLVSPCQQLQSEVGILHEVARLPVKFCVYMKNMSIADELFERISLSKSLSYYGVLSCLAAYKELKIDLIPDETRMRKALEARAGEMLKTGILAFTACMLIFLMLLTKIYFDTLYLKRLQAHYAPVSRDAQKLDDDFTRIARLKNYLAKRGFSLEALGELYNLVTDDIRLSDIRFEGDGKFTVRGTATTMSDVFSFVEKMAKSKYYKDVKTKYTTKRREGTRDVTDFEIASLLAK